MVKVGFKLSHGQALSGFFDRPKVLAEVDRATLRVLRTAGFRVRRTARRSLQVKPYAFKAVPPWEVPGAKQDKNGRWRTADGKFIRTLQAPAGKPPIAHEEDGLRKIFYSWDSATRAMVVGPVLFARKVDGKTIPEIHEFGAQVKASVFEAGVGMREVMSKYPQRPFMGPALEKHIPELPGLWKDVLAK